MSLYSGTTKKYSTKPLFAYLKTSQEKTRPRFSFDKNAHQSENDSLSNARNTINRQIRTEKTENIDEQSLYTDVSPPVDENTETIKEQTEKIPQLGFDKTVYETTVEGEFDVVLVGSHLTNISTAPLEILYNPKLLKFVDSSKATTTQTNISIQSDAEKGLLKIKVAMEKNSNHPENMILAKLHLAALKPGISYLVYRTTRVETYGGESIPTELQTARVDVK